MAKNGEGQGGEGTDRIRGPFDQIGAPRVGRAKRDTFEASGVGEDLAEGGPGTAREPPSPP